MNVRQASFYVSGNGMAYPGFIRFHLPDQEIPRLCRGISWSGKISSPWQGGGKEDSAA
jgi:hypothetical protein